MKILIIHNRYQHHGGEDVVVQQEAHMLRQAGHDVMLFERSNLEITEFGVVNQALLPVRAIWSSASYHQIDRLIDTYQPDLVHLHNLHALLSPAVVSACTAARVPTVMTLHNWRLVCPAATLYRAGEDCSECIQQGTWRGVLHRCYRGSASATATLGLSNLFHEWTNTWRDIHFVVLSDCARRRFSAQGFTRLHVKPNFVAPDPGVKKESGHYALFVGSLSEAKGLRVLLAAWRGLKPEVPLHIVGDGPLREEAEAYAEQHLSQRIHFHGQLTRVATLHMIQHARLLVVSSQWPEPFGMVAIEALACGVPVVASNAGALPEIIQNGMNGFIFAKHESTQLADGVRNLWDDAHLRRRLAEGARASYLARYTAEINYPRLMEIYSRAGAPLREHVASVA